MPVSREKIVRVAVPSPLRRLFDYRVKDNCPGVPKSLDPGMRVSVPFGRRQVVGIILEIANHSEIPAPRLKDVSDFIDQILIFWIVHLATYLKFFDFWTLFGECIDIFLIAVLTLLAKDRYKTKFERVFLYC